MKPNCSTANRTSVRVKSSPRSLRSTAASRGSETLCRPSLPTAGGGTAVCAATAKCITASAKWCADSANAPAAVNHSPVVAMHGPSVGRPTPAGSPLLRRTLPPAPLCKPRRLPRPTLLPRSGRPRTTGLPLLPPDLPQSTAQRRKKLPRPTLLPRPGRPRATGLPLLPPDLPQSTAQRRKKLPLRRVLSRPNGGRRRWRRVWCCARPTTARRSSHSGSPRICRWCAGS